MTSRLARVAAGAAALFITATSFAEGTFTPELGLGYGSGKEVGIPGDRQTFTYNLAFGYTADNGFGGRIIAIADGDFVRGWLTEHRSFDNFVGVQGTYSMPLRDRFNLVGGLGLGRTKLDDGDGGSAESKTITDGIVSAGLQWRPNTHYAMELRVSHLTSSNTTSTSLQFQVPF